MLVDLKQSGITILRRACTLEATFLSRALLTTRHCSLRDNTGLRPWLQRHPLTSHRDPHPLLLLRGSTSLLHTRDDIALLNNHDHDSLPDQSTTHLLLNITIPRLCSHSRLLYCPLCTSKDLIHFHWKHQLRRHNDHQQQSESRDCVWMLLLPTLPFSPSQSQRLFMPAA